MRARLQQFVVNDRTAQRKKTAAAPRHLQALATTEDEQQTLDAVRDYVCAGGPDAAEFAFARAHHYFELNRFAEAGILFDAIALGDAAGDFAQGARRSAAMLALESMNTIGSEQGRPACYEAIALHAQLYVAKLCVGVAGETSDDHDCRILRRVLGPLKHAPGCTLEIKAQSSP